MVVKGNDFFHAQQEVNKRIKGYILTMLPFIIILITIRPLMNPLT